MYSAAVRAKRGVSRRWALESLARFRNSTVRASAPLFSISSRKNSALSWGMPMPANTIAKSPAARPSPGRRALQAMSTAMRSWGSPPPEKRGSFWPRTRLFMRSMAVKPVSRNSLGASRAEGLMGSPSTR